MTNIIKDLEKQKKPVLKKAHCDCPKCWWNFGWIKIRKFSKKQALIIVGVIGIIAASLFLFK